MKCVTIKYENGLPVERQKRQFNTLEEAIVECKKLNQSPRQIHKLVAYKCNRCHKFHIGRSHKEIDNKYIDKINTQNRNSWIYK